MMLIKIILGIVVGVLFFRSAETYAANPVTGPKAEAGPPHK